VETQGSKPWPFRKPTSQTSDKGRQQRLGRRTVRFLRRAELARLAFTLVVTHSVIGFFSHDHLTRVLLSASVSLLVLRLLGQHSDECVGPITRAAKRAVLNSVLFLLFVIDLSYRFVTLVLDPRSIGNRACLCGSGRKFRECCRKHIDRARTATLRRPRTQREKRRRQKLKG
jgi:hypothetical protein